MGWAEKESINPRNRERDTPAAQKNHSISIFKTKNKNCAKSAHKNPKFGRRKVMVFFYAAILAASLMRLETDFLICGATVRLLNLLMVLNCNFGTISSCD